MAVRTGTYLRGTLGVIALSFSGLMAGCAYHGSSASDLDNPGVQKFAWFSFLDGHDIREACASLGPQGSTGAPAQYRLVYNGQYSEQIRAYEIVGQPSGGAALTARAKGHSNLSDWWIAGTQDLPSPGRQQVLGAGDPPVGEVG